MENICLGKRSTLIIFKKSTILNKKKLASRRKNYDLKSNMLKKNYDLKSNMLKHKAPEKPHTLDYISRLFIHSLSKNPLTSLQACKPERCTYKFVQKR